MTKAKRVLMFEDKEAIARVDGAANLQASLLNNIVSAYNELGLGSIKCEEVADLIKNAPAFVKAKVSALLPELPSFGAFKMKEGAFLDQIETPCTDKLCKAVEELDKASKRVQFPVSLSTFDFKDGQFSVNKIMLEQAKDSARRFAANEQQEGFIARYNAFLSASNELHEFLKQNNAPQGLRHLPAERIYRFNDVDKIESNPWLFNYLGF
jgi:hypothetical protein